MGENNFPSVEKVHNERLSGMGRRRFIKTLSGLGFSSAAALHLTPSDVEAAGSNEVPIVLGYQSSDSPDRSPINPKKRNVPADWYNDFQHAKDVFERKKQMLMKYPGVKGVWLEPGEYGGGNASLKVDIETAKIAETRGEVPETIKNVPIEIGEVDGYKLGYKNASHFPDKTPGGIKIGKDSAAATLGTSIYSPGDQYPYFITAGHFVGKLNGDHVGEKVNQPNGNKPALGEVKRVHCVLDAALIDPLNGHSTSHTIEDANPSENVTGWFSKDGLADLKSKGEHLEKYGITTGRTDGKIEAVDGTTSFYGPIGCRTKSGQIKWGDNNDFDDGDSGSMNYHAAPTEDGSSYKDDEIWVGGLNNARTEDWAGTIANYVWGTAAWKLNNTKGYRF